MNIGGLQPFTSIDYPKELAAVVFCQGCPWRCGYCHNPELIPVQNPASQSWPQLLDFLRQRQGLLDAVVFSGGEPSLQKDLPQALQDCRALGFKTGLHTAGCYPERLAQLLPLLDWVGLDIKALPDDYPLITQTPHSGDAAWQALRLLLSSGLDCEIRITLDASLYEQGRLARLLSRLADEGVPVLMLQALRPPLLDADGSKAALVRDLMASLGHRFERLELRPV